MRTDLFSNLQEQYTGEKITIKATYFEYLVALQVRENSPIDKLTERERLITQHFALGKTYKEIAREFEISPSTVKNHINKAYLRLGVNDKASLANLYSGINMKVIDSKIED